MTARLNDQEWEMLSAYIDGRLSSSDKTRLEQRMQSDPEMAAAFRSLIKTRIILQAAPRVKRRRNFYLTPEMLRTKGWIGLIPVLNFSSVTAALLAVLLFILNIFPLAPAMNRASAPPVVAPMVQDSAIRPATEKPTISETLVPKVAAAQEQGGGIGNNTESSEEIAMPTAKLPGNVATSGGVEVVPAAPAAGAPQIFAVPRQPAREPADSTPAMKESPPETLAGPAAAQAAPPSVSKAMPSPTGLAENYAQPNAPQIEPAVLPTSQAAEKVVVPSPTSLVSVTTQPAPVLPEQKSVGIPGEGLPEIEASPPNKTLSTRQTPVVESVRPAETTVQSVPIPWVKIGWIAMLTISGIFALLSAVLQKRSRS
jgi:anti-sigma factor RsiW